MEEPAERATAGAVFEVELDLDDAMPRAHGVDRHCDLHAEAVRERQHVFERSAAQRALTGDRRACAQPAGARANGPAREPEREPESAAEAPAEHRHGEIALAARDRIGERAQLRGRVAEVPVAENEERLGGGSVRNVGIAQGRQRGARDGGSLSDRIGAA
jgi:hypothetical protein